MQLFNKFIFTLITISSVLMATHSTAEPMRFTEQNVEVGNGIIGTVCQPVQSKLSPMVLLLHGFASKKDEVGNLSKRLAAGLCENGIASLRIAFRGWGESAGEMTDISVKTELDDAETAYQYLKTLTWIDKNRMGIAGFSMGGGIAILSTAKHPQDYKSLVTWSSVGDFQKDFLSLGEENFAKAARDGQVSIDLGWRQVTLGQVFFASLDDYDVEHAIQQYQGAYLAIAGSEDFSSAYTENYVTNSQAKSKKALIISGADHIFGVLEEDQTTAETVLQETIFWFKDTL